MHVECILSEPAYFDDTKPALDTFFLTVLFPLLLTGRRQLPEGSSNHVSQPDNHPNHMAHQGLPTYFGVHSGGLG